MGEPNIVWCRIVTMDGLVHACWRRNMEMAQWKRLCKDHVPMTDHTTAVVDDDRPTTCFWCLVL